MKDFQYAEFIVCIDADLSSTDNRKFNNKGGRAFITTQSIKKLKKNLKEWCLETTGWKLEFHGTDKEVYELNQCIIEEEAKYDGFYAVCTNLEEDVPSIVKINHNHWEIEECFRIMKTDFSSRPAYVRTDDRIKSHFMTCFLSLILFRYLEKKLEYKYTSEEILNTLRGMNFLSIPYRRLHTGLYKNRSNRCTSRSIRISYRLSNRHPKKK